MSIPLPEWLRLFDSEYLQDFIPSGGATVKVLVGPQQDHLAITQSVVSRAISSNFVAAVVDAADTRVHLVDQIYNRVAQQVDWAQTADRWLRSALAASLLVVPPGAELAEFDRIAEASGIDRQTLAVRINQTVMRDIERDENLWSEFRYGMVSYCVSRMVPQSIPADQAELILQWLRGERVSLAQLKRLRIHQRIGRNNARPILSSTANWLRKSGAQGLLLVLDLSSVFDPVVNGGLRYSRAMLLDLYELLRQFIDETDVTPYLGVVAIAGPGMIDSPKRSYNEYEAFKLRVVDDVRDPVRDNPLNALVRIDAAVGDEETIE